MTRRTQLGGRILLVSLTVGLLLAAGWGRPSAYAGAGASVMVMQNAAAGQYLIDPNGMTLYTFSADTPNNSSCVPPCSIPWKPFVPPSANLSAPAGVTGTLAVMTRSDDGTQQVTYNQQSLYTFVSDANPGDVNGQGVNAFGGTWSVAAP